MFFLLTDRNIEFILYVYLASQQKVTRPPPPPPPTSLPSNPNLTSNNKDYTDYITLNPDIVQKFTSMMDQNDSLSSTSSAPPPPPPPRGVTATNSGGTVRRPPPTLSDSVDTMPANHRSDQSNTGALDYDHDFENRFRFTPIENLPPPEPWKPQPVLQTKPLKNVNAT